MDVALAVHPRVDIVFGFEYSSQNPFSEYRDLEEDNGEPITQKTKLTTMPFTGSAKFYLTPRGRSISRFAFIPARFRAYVGVGGGMVWAKLEQQGDFVDFIDLAIFTAKFSSTGWSTEIHAFGGVDIHLAPVIFLSLEARYMWADVELSGDFVGFDPMDLSALQTTAGLNVRF